MNGVVILPSRRDRPYFLRREVRTFRTFAASEWVCRTEYQLHQLIPQSPRQSPKTCAAACSEVTLDVARIFPLHRGWAHNGAPGHNGWETAVCFGVCCSHWNEGGIFVWKDLTWAYLLHVTNKKKKPCLKMQIRKGLSVFNEIHSVSSPRSEMLILNWDQPPVQESRRSSPGSHWQEELRRVIQSSSDTMAQMSHIRRQRESRRWPCEMRSKVTETAVHFTTQRETHVWS